jgi:hypothetical protein
VERLSAAWPLIRDIAIVLTALGLIVYEAVFREGPERQSFLLLYTGMLGLPLVIRRDDRQSNGSPSGQGTAEAER